MLVSPDKADELREASSLRADADDHLVQVVAIVALLLLAKPARVDAEHIQQELDVFCPALTDDGESDPALSSTAHRVARVT